MALAPRSALLMFHSQNCHITYRYGFAQAGERIHFLEDGGIGDLMAFEDGDCNVFDFCRVSIVEPKSTRKVELNPSTAKNTPKVESRTQAAKSTPKVKPKPRLVKGTPKVKLKFRAAKSTPKGKSKPQAVKSTPKVELETQITTRYAAGGGAGDPCEGLWECGECRALNPGLTPDFCPICGSRM